MENFSELHFTMASEAVRAISDEFEDETERRPTISELLEILTWTLRGIDSNLIEDIHPYQLLGLEHRLLVGVAVTGGPDDILAAREEVTGLNDPVFVIASDSLADLARRVQADIGRPPSIRHFCQILVEGLRRCEPNILSNNSPSQILDIHPATKKGGKIKVSPGDIIAVPAKEDKYYLACVITKNQFGTAFGFFKGATSLRPVSLSHHPEVFKFPLYSGEEEIVNGRWKIIEHDETLLALFPSKPEIFHRKSDSVNIDDPEIGPFGSGETLDGELRDLTEEEARELGLLSGRYHQVYLEEHLESELPHFLDQ